VKTRNKVIIYIAIWLIALFCADFSFSPWPLAYIYPLGLFAFLLPEWRETWSAMIAPIVIYVALAVLYFRSKSVRNTIIWLVVTAALLTCNTAGCHQMLHAH
jgi:hypothetical protein